MRKIELKKLDMVMGQNIKDLREQLGLSQTEMCAQIGMDQTTLSAWECGRRSAPAAIYSIVEVLGCEISDVLPKSITAAVKEFDSLEVQ